MKTEHPQPPKQIDYPDCTMVEMIEDTAKKYPEYFAYEFFGSRVTYRTFMGQIDTCAASLLKMGISCGDRVTICLPNCPQALIMLYAVNKIGAVSNMIHPLSAQEEIAFYLNHSGSVACITLDQFYGKFKNIGDKIHVEHMIITSMEDTMNMAAETCSTEGRETEKILMGENVVYWGDFLRLGDDYPGDIRCKRTGGDTAAILYSGGTTGDTKGILLSNSNFNALVLQTIAGADCVVAGHRMLAIMPIFHGFGLGVCVHMTLVFGGMCILIPQFTPKTYAALLKKHRPHYIIGVPTLFEALMQIDDMERIDLSQLEGVFSGGDSLSISLKRDVDTFLREHGAKVQVREGYGMTECVAATCLTPKDFYREGSIGIPFPDMLFKIVTPATHDTLPWGEVGEICISGPTVMQGYLDDPRETSSVLHIHEDGREWLHTGDLGTMDEDGFVYFKQRLKRMIVSSGYNIYPSHIENIIDSHECVFTSTVIGVRDRYRMQKVKAFIVLKRGIDPTDEVKLSILTHCEKNIAKYAMPYEFEYRSELPKTLVGKIAYRTLEKEQEK